MMYFEESFPGLGAPPKNCHFSASVREAEAVPQESPRSSETKTFAFPRSDTERSTCLSSPAAETSIRPSSSEVEALACPPSDARTSG
jgi:hypothetical protein